MMRIYLEDLMEQMKTINSINLHLILMNGKFLKHSSLSISSSQEMDTQLQYQTSFSQCISLEALKLELEPMRFIFTISTTRNGTPISNYLSIKALTWANMCNLKQETGIQLAYIKTICMYLGDEQIMIKFSTISGPLILLLMLGPKLWIIKPHWIWFHLVEQVILVILLETQWLFLVGSSKYLRSSTICMYLILTNSNG